jgi:hypothetical protein
MADVMSILSVAITTVQKLREVAKKIKDAETNNLIADLNMALADLKMQFVALQEENVQLRRGLQQAREETDVRKKVSYRDGFYYLKEVVEGRLEGPYCTRCLDAENKLILVTEVPKEFREELGNRQCPECQTLYP